MYTCLTIKKISGGDENLIQEGAIGIWEGMQKEPEAPDRYYAAKAKWNIQNVSREMLCSVFCHQKRLLANALPDPDLR